MNNVYIHSDLVNIGNYLWLTIPLNKLSDQLEIIMKACLHTCTETIASAQWQTSYE